MKKITILLFSLMLFSSSSYSQDSLYKEANPFRVGVKFGLPNLKSLNLEYVTPVLNGNLSFTLDYGTATLNSEGWILLINSLISNDFLSPYTALSVSYLEIGSNYYLRKVTRGFYGRLSYSRMTIEGDFENQSDFLNILDTEETNWLGATGESDEVFNLINLGVGRVKGKKSYLRWEIGYTILLDQPTFSVQYQDPLFTTENNPTNTVEEPFPAILKSIYLNLGLGIAF